MANFPAELQDSAASAMHSLQGDRVSGSHQPSQEHRHRFCIDIALHLRRVKSCSYQYPFVPLIIIGNLYNDLLKTPGYLWRDSAFIGVIPVYEWSSDEYSDSQAAYQ